MRLDTRLQVGQSAHVEPHRLRVRVNLLTGDMGGRSKPVFSGYRCQWRSARKPEWNDAKVEFDDERLNPGAATDATLTLSVPSSWRGVVEVGDSLEGGEGSRVVATATVLAVMGA